MQIDASGTATAHPATRWSAVAVPLSGPLALVAMVAAGTLYEPTAAGANPTQAGARLLGFFAEDVEHARTGAALYLLAAFGLLVFGAALWDRLRRDRAPQWPAALAAGGALAAALFMVDGARAALAAMVAVESGDEVTVQVLVTTGWESARLVMPAAGAMMLGAAVAGLHGALPRWFAWLSLAGAVAALGTLVVMALPTAALAGMPAGMVAMTSLAWAAPAGVLLAWRALRRAGPR